MPIALALLGLLASASVAQEGENREEASAAARTRQKYSRPKVTVKDPADFMSKGKQIFSGPQPGEKLPEFKATSLMGDSKGKEIAPNELAAERPQILVFQDDGGVAARGINGILRAVETIDRKAKQDLHVACVFLCDDTETMTRRFAGLFPRLRERGIEIIAVSKDGRDGPGAYGLNRAVSQTIILAKGGTVTHNFVFPQGMLFPDPHVMGGIAEIIDEDREVVEGWLADAFDQDEQMRMRRDESPQSDARNAFREKLGEFVRAGKLTRKEAAELYRAAFPGGPSDDRQ
ncbi:MAG: hypothetical protein AAF802_25745 [Planctomycetota bacterium]